MMYDQNFCEGRSGGWSGGSSLTLPDLRFLLPTALSKERVCVCVCGGGGEGGGGGVWWYH